jgi:NADPH-dependent 2,4-dienoyl-CoA reductase/sulfur reductase-like enzyme
MEIVRGGIDVRTGEADSSKLTAFSQRIEAHACDVAVVGGGPAGVAAACRAAEAGARTVLLDEGAAPGGQIFRHLPGREAPPAARAWLARLAQSGAEVRAGVSVFDAARTDADQGGAPVCGRARVEMLCVGRADRLARDRASCSSRSRVGRCPASTARGAQAL